MKIGVISDTHILGNTPAAVNNLCKLIEPYFKDVRAILHAGDIKDVSVIESLEAFSRVIAVAGNMDTHDVYLKYGDRKIINFGRFKIGLMHGWGPPEGLSHKVSESFADDKVDCVVFGHTHFPYNKIEDNVLMFNPGSALEPRYSSKRTIGILHLNKDIRGEHIVI